MIVADFIAVIATVLNEGESIRGLMDSLVAQTRPPDQVVIVDGGSRDHTVSVLRDYAGRLPLRVIEAPGCNISAGRNRAIAAVVSPPTAGDPIIASTDAGVVLDSYWLERLVQPLIADPALAVSAGFFRADPHTVFEAALGATSLPAVDEIDPLSFLPSSRSVAFRQSAWARVGGYPEWLDYCEDLIFDLRLKMSMPNGVAFVPDAVVYFRPRGSLGAFYKQYYRYARGDGKADLWRKRHTARYVTYLIGLPVLVGLGVGVHLGFWAVLVLGGLIYVRTPYRRLRAVLAEAAHTKVVRLTPMNILGALVWVPVIRLVGDLAKMIGYPVGWWWRLQQRPPDWKQAGTS